MHPGSDPMGGPTSFSARRPNASNLPNFELPPPPLSGIQKFQSYPNSTQPTAPSSSVTSFGNLLTPPSNGSADGLTPSSQGVASNTPSSTHGPFSFTPSAAANGMWPPPSNTTSPYGFPSAGAQHFGSSARAIFSPSLNSIVRSTNSPSDSLPPPPYELPNFSSGSMAMSAPSLPAIPSHQTQQMIGSALMGGSAPSSTTQASPVNQQDAFSRPPPTPSYYSQPSTTPQQSTFPYSSGPSPTQITSPVSTGGMARMSPPNPHGSIGGMSQHPQQTHQHQGYAPPSQPRYGYPMSGPVLSNVNNPGGGLALVGGMPSGMMGPGGAPGFNSGHAAQMHGMYGPPHHHHHHAAPNPQTDRPFRCDLCPQSFNRNHDLKRHKRIHLAVKPFPCNYCDKSFSRKDALKRHILVKGCGKAQATTEVKEIRNSDSGSPRSKGSTGNNSPMVAHA